MLWKTHLSIGIAALLYFLPYINNKPVFIAVVLISSFLPDIDSDSSYLGHNMIFRPLQWIFSHRGMIHSYTFCLGISLILALLYPPAAFPFFLGYSFHLAADSFTEKGIKPFWPMETEVRGMVRTGGPSEYAVFVVFVLIDLALLMLLFI